MGNVPAVDVLPDTDSPSDAGKRSVVSGPLDEYCDYASFFEELIPLLKEPLYPLESYVLKSIEIKDIGPEVFTVKVYHDGDKLRTYGFGEWVKGDGDLLRLWNTVRCSRENRQIAVEHHSEDGQLQQTFFTRFLKDPLRVEFWCERPNGERIADEGMANTLKSFFIIPVLQSLMKRKVQVNPCIESPGGGGKSAISDPLTEYLAFNTCFDFVIEVLKDSVDKGRGEITDVSDQEFEMVVSAPNLGDADAPVTKMLQHVRHNRDRGEVVNVASIGGQLLYTSWIVVHREPVIVEHWTEVDGKRICGRQEARVLQNFVDSIVAKTDGSSGWFF
mmetsp:Transcript_23991/g.65414  ORF Transcript_23991/g.65414 Transcript_23991/m.65414 type:complete len:331 (-) Transcript_23991:59-1051(-)|eukprot:CAMPEP_0171180114 /NCGR_PEP_ID=MMETSP0790-20130122/13594_1 /TAXON_ID=2925 /ORGANISM="Alexandrium catenella, Strain OF101" /LENGTH=330 /DNA_ID=CAMNT_0011645045 /DNA_START=72 /DNA_END=1064 /DNA_ORIENTATION=+